MKQKLLRKVLSAALSVLMLTGTGLALPAVIESGTITVSAAKNENYEYDIIDGTITIKKYFGNDTIVKIPAEINGKTVTAIYDSAFSKC